jgi:hypothetical protein
MPTKVDRLGCGSGAGKQMMRMTAIMTALSRPVTMTMKGTMMVPVDTLLYSMTLGEEPSSFLE